MANIYLLIFAVGLYTVAAYTGPDLPIGPYCGGRGSQCCENRQDGCSHKILDTLCYCDQFCNRTSSHDDCCPDYGPVCLGEPQEYTHVPTCNLNGKSYFKGDTAMNECNKCKCLFDDRQQATRWECEQDECIMNQGVIDYVKRSGLNWRPERYSQFVDKKLKDGLIYKLGTLPLSPATERMGPIRYNKNIDYPTHFDARKEWPGYISPIVDQGWCGSDWAVTLASVVSDRFAIQSNGAEGVILSPQTLLSCNVRQQRGCDGGHVDIAWNFAKNFGLVDDVCFRYEAARTACPFKPKSTLQEDGCHASVKQRTSRYKVGPVSRFKNLKDIMYDIMSSGPVFGIMTVYQDFFHYRDGIYRHSQFGERNIKGLHSVRIIGWGEENSNKYWLVANSWGRDWGEDGYFRIARETNESGIESFVVSATSEVVAFQKK